MHGYYFNVVRFLSLDLNVCFLLVYWLNSKISKYFFSPTA